MVVHLALGEQQDQGTAVFVHDGMELGVQAAFRASDTAGNIPFINKLAAVRCALRCVSSIINCSGVPRSPACDVLRNPEESSSAKLPDRKLMGPDPNYGNYSLMQ